ncbi:MAG: glutamine--tRNA ligase/YqeY domain fusion protein [Bacteroidales bacterium]|jgi:glutaminyl-tRNA synthetase|nr:glutamine--tRNA ligase/YqeY domain fusion protein [Bacteroidales bacterium]MDI9576169.1 glutamine--tRNA ligase/YqeY domain fusion protein [Bacteroidota bacterium]MDD2593170.1 glutamine--tRNA ligase/YqeY domain fusion protein [Bacteroidales bacterium]MDD3755541.1 glutamine--tRNA ligase/YqeY domain fusion protein [Bacteroidales bacterium]MDY0400672.1 glutamine--tRNA ligase/YqeY domain fusion protein [Bacteroidales bacterium]
MLVNKNTKENRNENKNFIEEIIDRHLLEGRFETVKTRFPPEPNGYLHIGHAKSICLNFGIAKKYNGTCNLRFDDTNPSKENKEYIDSIKEDVKWLGFQWDKECYASDYFEQLYEWAILLIKKGKAYVCDCPQELISKNRTKPTEPGIPCKHRDRSIDENLLLFNKMKTGEYSAGSRVLRAKIDMNSPNMHMRDPIMYRIMYENHPRTGDKWCIYPTYDWAHGQSDSIEKITHSLCTLEFEVHRPLYEWFIKELNIWAPQQIEFARLNLSYTIMSKRKLLQLVEGGYVSGWDDPRMPTISGLRRRGFTPESIKMFIEIVGIAKRENLIEYELLEHCLREDLNKRAPRRMAVINPLKLVITNYPENQVEWLEALNNPEDPMSDTRLVPFSKEIFIEHSDFMENPTKKYHRFYVGNEVRLRWAYFIKCTGFKKDDNGNIVEIYGEYDPASRGGNSPDGRKVKSTIHWVSVEHAIPIVVRLYEKLFTIPDPDNVEADKTFIDYLNPNSLITTTAYGEPALNNYLTPAHYQFERLGYFVTDPDSNTEHIVFNLITKLKDSFAKKI